MLFIPEGPSEGLFSPRVGAGLCRAVLALVWAELARTRMHPQILKKGRVGVGGARPGAGSHKGRSLCPVGRAVDSGQGGVGRC